MRRVISLVVVLTIGMLAGCGTPTVRCDVRLTPINAPVPPAEERMQSEAP